MINLLIPKSLANVSRFWDCRSSETFAFSSANQTPARMGYTQLYSNFDPLQRNPSSGSVDDKIGPPGQTTGCYPQRDNRYYLQGKVSSPTKSRVRERSKAAITHRVICRQTLPLVETKKNRKRRSDKLLINSHKHRHFISITVNILIIDCYQFVVALTNFK